MRASGRDHDSHHGLGREKEDGLVVAELDRRGLKRSVKTELVISLNCQMHSFKYH